MGSGERGEGIGYLLLLRAINYPILQCSGVYLYEKHVLLSKSDSNDGLWLGMYIASAFYMVSFIRLEERASKMVPLVLWALVDWQVKSRTAPL